MNTIEERISRLHAGRLIDRRGRELLDIAAYFLPELLLRKFIHREPDDREILRYMVALAQVVERRNQLARGQVSGRAEDHHDAAIGGPPAVLRRLRIAVPWRYQFPVGRSTCPPNLLRIAESSLSENV